MGAKLVRAAVAVLSVERAMALVVPPAAPRRLVEGVRLNADRRPVPELYTGSSSAVTPAAAAKKASPCRQQQKNNGGISELYSSPQKKRRRGLNPDEEKLLGCRVRRLVAWEAKRKELNSKFGRKPTEVEWATAVDENPRTFAAKVDANRRAKDTFVSENLPLVYAVAKKYTWGALAYEDVVQEGIFGLSRAVERFDPERGTRFSTYAVWWIQKAIAAAVVDHSKVIRIPPRLQQELAKIDRAKLEFEQDNGREPTDSDLAKVLDVRESRIEYLRNCRKVSNVVFYESSRMPTMNQRPGGGGGFSDKDAPASEFAEHDRRSEVEEAEAAATRQRIKALLNAALNPRELRVIELRFGLADGDPKSLKQIAQIVKKTPEQINSVKTRAFNKLRSFAAMAVLREAHVTPAEPSYASAVYV
mmetsp:Transcript_8204/g.26889  ORF Transcript_8204/g.26889 Transcript_8204/m.26889 type:complete len:417 (-) Transcript_8204:595-1845(-)